MREEKIRAIGIWSFVGLLGLIFGVTFCFGVDYLTILSDFWRFLIGGVHQITTGYSNLLDVFGTIGAITVISVITCLCVGVLISSIKGKAEDVLDFLDKGEGYHIALVFFIVLLEELFARYLFLGVLTRLFTGTLAFYILMLVGNSLWALVHVWNYKKKDQSVLRVLPQFVEGLFLSYIYVRYGLIITVLAHFTYNAVLFAMVKKQGVGLRNLGLVLYYGIGFGIIWWILSLGGTNLAALVPWFAANPALTAIGGFGFWDYVLVFMAVGFGIDFLISVLLFDHAITIRAGKSTFLIGILLAPLIMVGLVYLANWLVGLLVSSVIIKALIVTVILILLYKTPSLSGASRSWFSNLPTIFLLVCAVSVLNFWSVMGLTALLMAADLIPSCLRNASGGSAESNENDSFNE